MLIMQIRNLWLKKMHRGENNPEKTFVTKVDNYTAWFS